jgi:hypothetical protein
MQQGVTLLNNGVLVKKGKPIHKAERAIPQLSQAFVGGKYIDRPSSNRKETQVSATTLPISIKSQSEQIQSARFGSE